MNSARTSLPKGCGEECNKWNIIHKSRCEPSRIELKICERRSSCVFDLSLSPRGHDEHDRARVRLIVDANEGERARRKDDKLEEGKMVD